MITLDTSGLLAYIRAGDRNHQACRAVIEKDPGPYIIPVAILAEIAYMIEATLAPAVELGFLAELRDGAYQLDWNEVDVARVQQLIQRYHDLPLGFADAVVIACGERNRGRVLSTDFRHFPVVARSEGTITVLPLLES